MGGRQFLPLPPCAGNIPPQKAGILPKREQGGLRGVPGCAGRTVPIFNPDDKVSAGVCHALHSDPRELLHRSLGKQLSWKTGAGAGSRRGTAPHPRSPRSSGIPSSPEVLSSSLMKAVLPLAVIRRRPLQAGWSSCHSAALEKQEEEPEPPVVLPELLCPERVTRVRVGRVGGRMCHKMSRFTPKQLLGGWGEQARAAREVSVPFPRSFQPQSCVRDSPAVPGQALVGSGGMGAPNTRGDGDTPVGWDGGQRYPVGAQRAHEGLRFLRGAEIPHERQFLLPHGEGETPNTSWEPQTPHTL